MSKSRATTRGKRAALGASSKNGQAKKQMQPSASAATTETNGHTEVVAAAGKEKPKHTVESVEKELQASADQLAKLHDCKAYCISLPGSEINMWLVDRVYDELTQKFPNGNDKLLVVISSSGGDIDAAFNLAKLLRRYGKEKLLFVVPRWAKSAATLVVCAGDEILMTPVAELGPLDPQITIHDKTENRKEHFSPLHIQSTLQLIAEQFKAGKTELASGLLNRLQFPLTLGSFKKTLDVGKDYINKLLSTRMIGDNASAIKKIADTLVEGFAHHGACIMADEAMAIGLKVTELTGKQEELAWRIYKKERHLNQLINDRKKREMNELIKAIPPELLDKIEKLV